MRPKHTSPWQINLSFFFWRGDRGIAEIHVMQNKCKNENWSSQPQNGFPEFLVEAKLIFWIWIFRLFLYDFIWFLFDFTWSLFDFIWFYMIFGGVVDFFAFQAFLNFSVFRNSNVRPEIPITTEFFGCPVFLNFNVFPEIWTFEII